MGRQSTDRQMGVGDREGNQETVQESSKGIRRPTALSPEKAYPLADFRLG